MASFGEHKHSTPPKRRFGKEQQKINARFRGPFQGREYTFWGYEPLKSQSKTRTLWSPIEDFGRRNNADFRGAFQWFVAQIEYSHQRNSQSNTRISSFVTPSKIVVWEAWVYAPQTTILETRTKRCVCVFEVLFQDVSTGKDFTTIKHADEHVRFVKWITKSGVSISRRYCCSHGL